MKTRIYSCMWLMIIGSVTMPVCGQLAVTPDPPAVGQETLTVSGHTGVPDVTMKGLPGDVKTDSNGRYVATVPLNWSGTVRPEKAGIQFRPHEMSLTRVKGDIRDMNFTAEVPSLPTSTAERDVLFVPNAAEEVYKFAAVQQDMRVMLHILKRAVQEEQTPLMADMFSPYGNLLKKDGQALPSLYIQGYGALFFVQAGIALEWSPEPALAVKTEGDDEASVDPVWREARDQVLNPAARPNQLRSSRRDTEALMRKIIGAMAHAANIRHMGPDERVVVTVFSGAASRAAYGMMGAMMGSPGGMPSDLYGRGGGYGGMGVGGAGGVYGGGGDDYMTGPGASTSRRGSRSQRGFGFSSASRSDDPSIGKKTTMTLEANRARINAFSKGQIGLDEFVQSMKVTKY